MEEISTTGKENLSTFTFMVENPVLPENMPPALSGKQKRISVWQIIILLLLFCLAIEEKSITGGNVFTVVLILTSCENEDFCLIRQKPSLTPGGIHVKYASAHYISD